jgi:hypothetical protein
VGDGWKEVIPVKPMSKINEDLFPVTHLKKMKRATEGVNSLPL